MSFKKHQILIWITIFAFTMGIFEGSVVVYLRALYYPSGFNFPLTSMDNHIALTELIRELASLFMLLSVGIIAGKNFSQRFAWFIYSFAVWDIIYYLFLYLILGWPASLFTWDILFLLPVTWTGPVIAPIVISILMIIIALLIYHFNTKSNNKTRITRKEWFYLLTGALMVFISFIWDYSKFLIVNISREELQNKSLSDKLFNLSVQYIPEQFPWFIFMGGVGLLIFSFFLIYKRNKEILK
ncbi:hypothetical protein ACFLS4_04680 [Bacteroidota bacterium]